jgi:hypothetical protein
VGAYFRGVWLRDSESNLSNLFNSSRFNRLIHSNTHLNRFGRNQSNSKHLNLFNRNHFSISLSNSKHLNLFSNYLFNPSDNHSRSNGLLVCSFLRPVGFCSRFGRVSLLRNLIKMHGKNLICFRAIVKYKEYKNI